jgi:hypothetical protein
MDLVELGARSMDLVDLEFLELGYLAGKKWSGAILLIWSCLEPSQTRLNNYHTTIISYRVCTHMPILKIRVHASSLVVAIFRLHVGTPIDRLL